MPRRAKSDSSAGNIVEGTFSGDLRSRRRLEVELPEFLVLALKARVAEAMRLVNFMIAAR
jgi:hypothetical protein